MASVRIASVSQILSVVNISASGAMLRGRIEATDDVLDLTLWWPHLRENVTLRARVVRVTTGFEVGVRFEDSDSAAALVRSLVARHERTRAKVRPSPSAAAG